MMAMAEAKAEAVEVTRMQRKGDSNSGGNGRPNGGGKRQWQGQQWQM